MTTTNASSSSRAGRSGSHLQGYGGRPVLKGPVWTWQIPLYFFIGGTAGGAAVIALACLLTVYDPGLLRAALLVALVGVLAGAGLLVWDLKRPKRFLYMLRVFKPSSPMSMGAWILTAFGAAVAAACVFAWTLPLVRHEALEEVGALALLATTGGAAILGALLATYTGVLIGGTAVPVWRAHHVALPIHFGAAGLGSAAALFLLAGYEARPLLGIGVAAALVETGLGLLREVRAHPIVDDAARTGRGGVALRLATVLTGPLALVLWLLGLGAVGGVTFLAGALLSRYGWLWAGQASAADPRAALVDQGALVAEEGAGRYAPWRDGQRAPLSSPPGGDARHRHVHPAQGAPAGGAGRGG